MVFRHFIERLVYYGLEAFGKYYSSYRGYVVDNNDPDNMGRLKLQVPSVARSKTLQTWAYPKHGFSGADYGTQLLPLIGDLVWVEFELGNPSQPLWMLGHFGKEERPEEFSSPQIYGFKSPKGQIIIIDDDKEEIIINHGENEGLVKVIELTQRLNAIEDKVKEFLGHYRTHQIVDPISGMAGPLLPNPPAPVNPINTKQSDIENEKVKH